MKIGRWWRDKVKPDEHPKQPDQKSDISQHRQSSHLMESLKKAGVNISEEELGQILYEMQETFAAKEVVKKKGKATEESQGEGGSGIERLRDDFQKFASGQEQKDDKPGTKNSFKKAPSVFGLSPKQLKERRLMNAFALIIGKVSEDLVGFPIEGDDEWDLKALSERRISKRKLTHCLQSREKDRVVLLLDSSGSCSDYAKFYKQISSLAANYGDIEMYDAPNGFIEKKWNTRTEKFEHKPIQEGKDGDYDYRWGKLRGRTVIFFGDWDGWDHIFTNSYRCKIFWFHPKTADIYYYQQKQERYFRGKFYSQCDTPEAFIRQARSVR